MLANLQRVKNYKIHEHRRSRSPEHNYNESYNYTIQPNMYMQPNIGITTQYYYDTRGIYR